MEESIISSPLSDGEQAAQDAGTIPGPGENECLRCFLMRMLSLSGCDGTHRWTLCWRDARAPHATGLLKELARGGGICCDCEVIFNVWPDYPHDDGLLPCAGVTLGCTDPCDRKGVYNRDGSGDYGRRDTSGEGARAAYGRWRGDGGTAAGSGGTDSQRARGR